MGFDLLCDVICPSAVPLCQARDVAALPFKACVHAVTRADCGSTFGSATSCHCLMQLTGASAAIKSSRATAAICHNHIVCLAWHVLDWTAAFTSSDQSFSSPCLHESFNEALLRAMRAVCRVLPCTMIEAYRSIPGHALVYSSTVFHAAAASACMSII